MNLVVMGPQGSGKSTQAKLLAQKLRRPHVSTGDIFRELAKKDSPLGRQAAEKTKIGELIDDNDTLKVIAEYLRDSQFNQGFVLDGFPRNLYQAQNFKHPLDQIFYLRVSDAEGIRRLTKRGRADDTSSAIRKRLDLYHQQTEPVLDCYRAKGLLGEIDGERSIGEIHEEILAKVQT